MNYKNEKDFFCRTLHNLKIYREEKRKNTKTFEYEATQLINSFLGLIVFIKDQGIEENEDLNTFLDNNQPKKWEYKKSNKEEVHDFANFLRHLRNAVAHPNEKLIANADNDDISSITFKDKDPKNPKNEFEANLTIEKIDELIELISKAFLASDQCTPEGRIKI
jgi:hypothetical protein